MEGRKGIKSCRRWSVRKEDSWYGVRAWFELMRTYLACEVRREGEGKAQEICGRRVVSRGTSPSYVDVDEDRFADAFDLWNDTLEVEGFGEHLQRQNEV